MDDRTHRDLENDGDYRRPSPRGRAGYRDSSHNDGYRSRQDYSRSPRRNELSYDDVPDVEDREDAARYGRHGHGRRDEYGRRDFGRSRDASGERGPDRDAFRDGDGYRSHHDHRTGGYSADRRREDYPRPRRDGDGYDEDGRYYESHDKARDLRYSSDDYPRRGRSVSPMRGAGTPSDTVILEGLPANVSSDEVRESLLKFPEMSRFPSFDVRVPPGRGRRAFVQFDHVDDAEEFVQGTHPRLFLDFGGVVDGDADGRTPVYVHFARNRDDPDLRGATGASDWECATCAFPNYATRNRCKSCGRPQHEVSLDRVAPTGESDAADTPSQLLVLFPLSPSVTEEILAVGAGKLELEEKPAASKQQQQPGDPPKLKSTAPVGDTSGYGARPGSLHRVFLMRDRDTNASLNFGFAEFWTVDDAMAAMTKFKKYREFTIASTPVTVSTIHTGVFVPDAREMTRALEASSFSPLFNTAIRVRYWDPYAFPAEKRLTETPPAPAGSKQPDERNSAPGNGDAKKNKKRKADGSLATGSAKKPTPMGGQMAMWQKKHDELHEGKPKSGYEPSAVSGSSASVSSNGAQGPIKISLSGKSIAMAHTSPRASASPPVQPQSGQTAPAAKDTPDPGDTASSLSYVDREKVCCLLCMMKYKSLDDLNTHERSRNHKTAMADEAKVKAAAPRLAARDKRMQMTAAAETKQPEAETESDATAPQYRDRAKERREVFNQPKKPSNQQQQQQPQESKQKSRDEMATAATNKPSGAVLPAQQQQSKGSAMLAKMGWTTGQGLGANGEGRTETIATHAYREGVGLGAEGSNLGDAAELAQKKTTDGYAEYLSAAQDKARERYNRMG